MFKTDMGSLAYQNIYDLLEIDNSLMYNPDTPQKDFPSGVAKTFPTMVNNFMDTREAVNDVITNWLAAVIIQERGMHDVEEIDEKLDSVLSQRGIVDDAKDIARPFVKKVKL